jgi:hypothetical protein
MHPLLSNLRDKLPPEVVHQLEKMVFTAREHGGPLLHQAWAKTKSLKAEFSGQAAVASLGSTFKHVLVVGLNRAELNVQGESQPIYNENWQELVSETMRRSLALVFFAPRGLDGEPVNPYLFLSGEITDSDTATEAVEATQNLAAQALQGIGLLDYCRVSPAPPNTVNMVLAADALFHWDIKDSYVLPTSPTSWVRDVEQVIKTYPRTTRANLFTQWDTEVLTPSERLKVHPLRALPLDPNAWLNQPTVQEKYGNHVLGTALVLAGLTGAGLWWQQSGINSLNEQLRMIEQQIPGEGRLSELERGITEQENMQRVREAFYVTLHDAARAAQNAGMKLTSIEVRNPDPNTAPKSYLVTFEAQKDAYKGWLEEEPIARAVLTESALLAGVRKLPGTGYKLEGLVPVAPVLRDLKKLAPQGGALVRGRQLAPGAESQATGVLPQAARTTTPRDIDAEVQP